MISHVHKIVTKAKYLVAITFTHHLGHLTWKIVAWTYFKKRKYLVLQFYFSFKNVINCIYYILLQCCINTGRSSGKVSRAMRPNKLTIEVCNNAPLVMKPFRSMRFIRCLMFNQILAIVPKNSSWIHWGASWLLLLV